MKAILLITTVLCTMACSGLFRDFEEPITKDQLPTASQVFINNYFPEEQIAMSVKDVDGFKVDYDINFASGKEVSFDKDGIWTELDFNNQPVPKELVPVRISEAVNKSFPGAFIVKLEKKKKGWEVELNNDIDLKFNRDFKMTEVER